MTNDRYTQAICEDGTAILFDGIPMTIEQILSRLNGYENQSRKEEKLIRDMLRKCDEELGDK